MNITLPKMTKLTSVAAIAKDCIKALTRNEVEEVVFNIKDMPAASITTFRETITSSPDIIETSSMYEMERLTFERKRKSK